MWMLRSCKGRSSSRTGATAVEFACVAPVLFLIVLATIELWRINMIVHMADQAVYEAARILVVPGADPDEGRAAANQLMLIAGARNYQIDILPAVIEDDTPEVTVSISVPTAENGWITPKFFTRATIDASITLARETLGE